MVSMPNKPSHDVDQKHMVKPEGQASLCLNAGIFLSSFHFSLSDAAVNGWEAWNTFINCSAASTFPFFPSISRLLIDVLLSS